MVSPEHMVLVNEVLPVVGQYTRGIDVSEEALALDVIDSVGPGDHKLMLDRTMQHFREAWYSALFDRNGYHNWSESGAKDLRMRERERTLALMAHPLASVDQHAVKALDEMSKHWV